MSIGSALCGMSLDSDLCVMSTDSVLYVISIGSALYVMKRPLALQGLTVSICLLLHELLMIRERCFDQYVYLSACDPAVTLLINVL